MVLLCHIIVSSVGERSYINGPTYFDDRNIQIQLGMLPLVDEIRVRVKLRVSRIHIFNMTTSLSNSASKFDGVKLLSSFASIDTSPCISQVTLVCNWLVSQPCVD